MKYSIKRKAQFLNTELQGDWLGKSARLAEIAAMPELQAHPELRIGEFHTHLAVLDAYRAQLEGAPLPNAAEVTEAQAEQAWDELSTLSEALAPVIKPLFQQFPSGSVNTALSDYEILRNRAAGFFTRVAKLERGYVPGPLVIDDPSAAPPAYDMDEVKPLLNAYAACRPYETLLDLQDCGAVTDNEELDYRRFLSAVSLLDNEGIRKSEDPGAKEQLAVAWSYIRENAQQIRDSAAAAAVGLRIEDPERRALGRLQSVAAGYCDIAARMGSREQLRRNAYQDQLIAVQARQAEQEKNVYNPQAEDDPDVSFAEDKPTAAQQRKDALTQYRADILDARVAFETEMPKLNRQIAEYTASIPADVLARFRNAKTLEQVSVLQDIILSQKNAYEYRAEDLENDLKQWSQQILYDAELDDKGSVADDMRSILRESRGLSDGGREKLDSLFRAAALPQEVQERLNSAFDQTRAQYLTCFAEINERERAALYTRSYTNLVIAELKRGMLVSTNRQVYQAEYERSAQTYAKRAEDEFREQFRGFADELGKMHKFGRNTEEFRAFRDALNAVAEGGSFETLRTAAQAYVDAKTRGGSEPSSDSGIGRLNTARTVLDILKTKQVLASVELPAAQVAPIPAPGAPIEGPAPMEEHRFDPQPRPLRIPAELEPPASYYPGFTSVDNDLIAKMDGFAANRLSEYLPRKQAQLVGRKLNNMFLRSLNGSPEASKDFHTQVEKEFYSYGKLRKPLSGFASILIGTMEGLIDSYSEEYQKMVQPPDEFDEPGTVRFAVPMNLYGRAMLKLRGLPLPANEGQQSFFRQVQELADQDDSACRFIIGMDDNVFRSVYTHFRKDNDLGAMIAQAQNPRRAGADPQRNSQRNPQRNPQRNVGGPVNNGPK